MFNVVKESLWERIATINNRMSGHQIIELTPEPIMLPKEQWKPEPPTDERSFMRGLRGGAPFDRKPPKRERAEPEVSQSEVSQSEPENEMNEEASLVDVERATVHVHGLE